MTKTPGQALVARLSEALGELGEWTPRESALLDLAARQADDLARLERAAAEAPTVNALREVRLQRTALARLVNLIGVPDEPGEPAVDLAKQRAARRRWIKSGARNA